MKHPDLPDNERRSIALQMLEGAIFTSLQFSEWEMKPGNSSIIGLVFMPCLFGAFEGYTQDELDDIGFLYEEMSKAGPRGINGYPVFTSFRVANKNDQLVIMEYYHLLRQQREQFLGVDPDQNQA